MPLPGVRANTLNPKFWMSSHGREFSQAELYIPPSWVCFPSNPLPHTFLWLLPRHLGKAHNSIWAFSSHHGHCASLPRLCWDGTHEGPGAKEGWRGKGSDVLGDRSTTRGGCLYRQDHLKKLGGFSVLSLVCVCPNVPNPPQGPHHSLSIP